ncbi:hypothetical protein [Nocardia camponoti]|uniref:Uncharacterized protein n=1 Tax=Nocardia camponoti TaxID=1616106 RepID=A0A917QB46_9NOCA|nr:hypothetical protein [Nocardia camponoti]GGK39639.1 hypothetical protein GCM10011591_09170 [Nocardia camponoti]
MRPLSSPDTGVIAPSTLTANESAKHALTTAPGDASGLLSGLPDTSLVQLPADVTDTAVGYATKLSDDANAGIPVSPAGLGGLSGLGGNSVQAQDILSGIPDSTSLLTGVQSTISQGAANGFAAAHSALNQAESGLAGVTGGSLGTGTASAGSGTATGATNSAASSTITDDPVSALLNGLSLPALPGIETLFEPILSLLSSFGTGTFGSIDPTSILSNSSSAIETAMSVAKSGLTTVQSLWEGKASDSATTSSQQAQNQGTEASQRGIDIASLTQQAAAVVQSGNAQLSAIATTFATQAAALAPTIMLPPTQAALIALATEHITEAVTVVNITRGQLAGHSAQLAGVVQQLAAQSGLPSPQDVLSVVSENAEPLLTQAQSALTGLTQDLSTTPAGTTPSGTTPGTSPAGLGTGGSPGGGSPGGSSPGGASLAGLGGKGGTTGTPSAGTPKAGTPAAAVPAARVMGTAGTMGTAGGAGTSMMGAPGAAGAGRGNGNEEHKGSVTPYQSRLGNDDLTGPLGEGAPEVIGGGFEDDADSDEARF